MQVPFISIGIFPNCDHSTVGKNRNRAHPSVGVSQVGRKFYSEPMESIRVATRVPQMTVDYDWSIAYSDGAYDSISMRSYRRNGPMYLRT